MVAEATACEGSYTGAERQKRKQYAQSYIWVDQVALIKKNKTTLSATTNCTAQPLTEP